MKLTKHAKFREEQFGGVLFETSTEKVFALNPTAAAVIREIHAAAIDEATLVERISHRFHDPHQAIEREIRTLIADLKQKGLVED